MYRLFLSLTLILAALGLRAENDCLLLSQGKTGFTDQTWFYSGIDNPLQADKIKEKWDTGYRITSGSFTSKGWFIVMSKGSGIGMQTYHYDSDWPSDWINEKRNDGYAINVISSDGCKWFIVMSQGTGITNQTWVYDTESETSAFIKKYWDKGYRITAGTAYKDKWLVVMSANSGIGAQTYNFCNGYDAFSSEVKKRWDENYVATVACADYKSRFFLVSSKFTGKTSPAQSYSVDTSDAKAWINSQWNSDKYISFVGGAGTALQNSYSAGNSSGYANNSNNVPDGNPRRMDLPGGNGYVEFTKLADGRTMSRTVQQCFFCHGTAVCSVCHGTGGTYNGYTGIYYPCNSCLQSGKCKYCDGTGTQILVSYIDPSGAAVGYANDGLPPVYTYPSDNSSSRDRGNSSRDRDDSRYGTYDCPTCHGTGVCQTCNGTGVADSYYTGGDMLCPNCKNHNGKCSVCNGTGKKYGVK